MTILQEIVYTRRKAKMWTIPHSFVFDFVIYLMLIVTYLPNILFILIL